MTIYPHKEKGVATGRYRIEVQRDGIRSVRYADNLKLAKRLEAMLKLGQDPDGDAKVKVYTTEDLFNDYKGLWAGQDTEDRTVARFETACGALKKALGTTPLREVNYTHLTKVAGLLNGAETHLGARKGSTTNRYLATLSKVLGYAEEAGKVLKRPTFKRAWNKESKDILFYLREDEQDRMRKELLKLDDGEDIALLMDAQVIAGCRVGELLTIKPDDVQRRADGNEVWYEMMLRNTKADVPRIAVLSVSLGERLVELLQSGRLPTYHVLRDRLRAARRAAGLETTQPTHAHRHTAGTRLTQRGVSLRTVQGYLGHATPAQTARYITVDTRDKVAAMRALLREE